MIESGYVRPAVLKDYVAELVLDLPGRLLRLVSVHASPRPAAAEDLLREWTRTAESRLWHADVVSAELAARRTGPFVAAGDFNEAHLWDTRYATRTSEEFFGRLTDDGIRDVTMDAWQEEKTTQVRHPYQVDRIFSYRVPVTVDVHSRSIGRDDGLSDHLPIWFTIS